MFSFLRDIISASLHTQDFTATRAQFIGKRLSWILRLLIVAIPLWWGIDALTLPAEYLPLLLRYRLLASGSLLLVATLLHFRRQWLMFCMTMSLLVLMLFHALCLLELSELDPLPVGFSLFPFVLMSLFAVLPLTLLASAALNLFITIACVLVVALVPSASLGGELGSLLWLSLLFSGAAAWVQAGQLLMLLQLYRESTTDPLTHLMNRRVFMRSLHLAHQSFAVRQQVYSVLLLDLDRFKRINDQHGHLVGDQVLRMVAALLRQTISAKQGEVARFGGEEFILLLSGTTLAGALERAEQLRSQISALEIQYAEDAEPLIVSVSIGVAEVQPMETQEALLVRADERLYQAKREGRNRVCG
jgi:diguanylate cyclase